MKEFNSFEKYAGDLLYNEIFQKLNGYIYANKDRLDLATYEVPDPSHVKLEDFEVTSAWFDNAPGYQLVFDLICSTEVEVSGRGKYDYETDTATPRFVVSCIGVLKDGLQDVRITRVDTYCEKKFDSQKRLSKNLVPYVFAKNLNEIAEDFLARYCPRALQTPMRLPLDEIIKHMGLQMVEAHITKNCDIFGQIYFSDAEINVYDKEKDDYVPMSIKAGTILVDPEVFFMRNIGSLNNTIMHECVHWDKHKKYFELQKLFRNKVSSISCHVVEGIQPEGKRTDLQWMEWQANALAPRILMPAKMTKKKIEELLIQYHMEYGRLGEADIMEMVIMELSDFFGVSLFAAKLRAIDLGYDQAVGVLNYYDYRYLPNYSFKQGSLKQGQTFVIKVQDAIYETASNPEFAEMIGDGTFIYTGCMFCINQSKYIEEDDNGNARLTEYARNHVDECCIKFDVIKKKNSRYGTQHYKECYLCHDIIADSFAETKFVDTSGNQDVKQRAEEMKKLRSTTAEIQKIQKEVPVTFGEALKYHMKRRGYTVEALSSASLIGPKTIQNMRNQDNYPFSLPVVAALCIGMHLHPVYSEDLLEKAGIKLIKYNEEHIVYKYLLTEYYKASIHECNEVLTEYDMDIMGTEQLAEA